MEEVDVASSDRSHECHGSNCIVGMIHIDRGRVLERAYGIWIEEGRPDAATGPFDRAVSPGISNLLIQAQNRQEEKV